MNVITKYPKDQGAIPICDLPIEGKVGVLYTGRHEKLYKTLFFLTPDRKVMGCCAGEIPYEHNDEDQSLVVLAPSGTQLILEQE